MSTKTKKLIIILAAIVIFCFVMTAGLILSGNLGRLLEAFGKDEPLTTQTQSEITSETVIERAKTEKPEMIRGIWFTAGVDYLTDTELAFDKTKIDIETKIAEIKAMGFNTIFLGSQVAADSKLFVVNGDGSSIFGYCQDFARSIGLYIVTAVPLNSFLNAEENFTIDNKAVTDFITAYNTDAIILTGIGKIEELAVNNSEEEKMGIISRSIQAFSDIALLHDSKLLIGTAADGEYSSLSDSTESVIDVTNGSIYVEFNTSGKNSKDEFQVALETIEKSISSKGGTYIAGLWADNSAENTADKTDLMNLLSLAESFSSCSGTAVRSYAVLKNDTTGRAAVFLEYLKNINKAEQEREFSLYNYNTADITTDESKISFTGSSKPGFPLSCNDKNVVTTNNGDFSIEYNLEKGINTFVFKQNEKSYTYNVTYNVDILKSVSPTGRISAPGGTVVEISAVAIRNADVTAIINKSSVKLTQGKTLDYGDEENSPDISSDFVTYTGKFTLPQGKTTIQNLGSISVQAKFNGLSKSLNGGKVSVTAKPPETTTAAPTQPETTSAVSGESTQPTVPLPTEVPFQGQQLTPYAYAGVPGTSRMCEIAIDYCESMPISTINNVSYPLTTPLLRGMFDYIIGESSYESYNYYHLLSGKRVYKEEVKVIENGFNLPLNNIQLINSSTDNDTNINLAMTWKVPINVVVKGQNYAQTYNNREFGVWSFTGNCIEFTFSQTNAAAGSINVLGSNTISSAEWIKDTSGNAMILRLYFKRTKVFYGYSLSYNSDGSLKISIKNKPSSTLSGYRIMLDPGHGGDDPGAICSSSTPSNLKFEKQINLALTLKVKEKLESQGATVILTRSDDSYVSVDLRRALAYEKKPDIFISIHCDSSNSSSATGTSAFYYYAQSFPLADSIHKQVLSCYSNNFYTTTDRHSAYYPFRVTRMEACPSILVEYGFVSNLNECKTLQNSENQNKLAEATVQGIINYINTN